MCQSAHLRDRGPNTRSVLSATAGPSELVRRMTHAPDDLAGERLRQNPKRTRNDNELSAESCITLQYLV